VAVQEQVTLLPYQVGTSRSLPSLVHGLQTEAWLRSDPGKTVQTEHVHKSHCGSGLNIFSASTETADFSRFHATQNMGVLCVNYVPELATCVYVCK